LGTGDAEVSPGHPEKCAQGLQEQRAGFLIIFAGEERVTVPAAASPTLLELLM